MKEEIRLVLSQFKKELETKFKFEESTLTELVPTMLGAGGLCLNFSSRISITISFWDSGILEIGGCYFKQKYIDLSVEKNVNLNDIEDIMDYTFSPKGHQIEKYPQESFDIFIEKIKELKKKINEIDFVLKQNNNER
jgi:hypothetical protein